MYSRLFQYNGGLHTVLVSEADAPVLDARGWSLTNCSRHAEAPKFYVRRVRVVEGKRKTEYLHRVIMGALPNVVVDHLNGNSLDCTRENMRCTTVHENARRQNHAVRRRYQ